MEFYIKGCEWNENFRMNREDYQLFCYCHPMSFFEGWAKAMKLSEEEKNLYMYKIISSINYPIESFAEGSADFSIGDIQEQSVRDWYYNNKIWYTTH